MPHARAAEAVGLEQVWNRRACRYERCIRRTVAKRHSRAVGDAVEARPRIERNPSIAWTGPNGSSSSSEDLVGLTAGAYVVTLSNASGTVTQTFTVNNQVGPDSDKDGVADCVDACPADKGNLANGCVADICDFNLDGSVDADDLSTLLSAWGCKASCAADVTGDGMVDGSDLGTLLSSWTG